MWIFYWISLQKERQTCLGKIAYSKRSVFSFSARHWYVFSSTICSRSHVYVSIRRISMSKMLPRSEFPLWRKNKSNQVHFTGQTQPNTLYCTKTSSNQFLQTHFQYNEWTDTSTRHICVNLWNLTVPVAWVYFWPEQFVAVPNDSAPSTVATTRPSPADTYRHQYSAGMACKLVSAPLLL